MVVCSALYERFGGARLINLAEVGAFPSPPTAAGVPVRFGVYLPGIAAGFAVRVLVIAEADRFDPDIAAKTFDLQQVGGPNGLWSANVTIDPVANTGFGQPGRYLYRYQLVRVAPDGSTSTVTDWFTDPFARETDDVGQLSAFTTPDAVPAFAWTDGAWKVPDLAELVVYELHVEEFNGTFAGVMDRLTYLQSLGVTCLELMPVTSLKLDFDWGYGPLHYFAPNHRWGGMTQLKQLVDKCHASGIAVILDVVYQHVDPTFPYHQVYADAGITSPMIGTQGPFGPVIDYSRQFSRDYVAAIGQYWLEEYHVDGFRYDEVTDLYDGPTGVQYASFAYNVYNESLKLPRFTPTGAAGEYSRVIQVPEALNRPQEILRATYSSSTWQDNLLGKVEDMVAHTYVDDAFALLLDADFSGYPRSKTVHDVSGNPVEMPVAPFQYLNSHDHSHLVAFLSGNPQSPYAPLADRSRWYKIQPLIVALYTAAGVPMLWQGQEFSENYVLASDGDLRVHFRRDMHWEYFYDSSGAPLIRLHRTMAEIRATHAALRSRDCFYYNQNSRPTAGVLAYRRSAPGEVAVVFLNFSDTAQAVTVPFPQPGTYRELVDERRRATPLTLGGGATGDPMSATVPSNYGYVFVSA